MIPFVAEVNIRHRRQRNFEFWIPLALLWILLLPLVILLLQIFLVACWLGRVAPYEALGVLWSILTSSADTEVAVDKPDFSFSVHLY